MLNINRVNFFAILVLMSAGSAVAQQDLQPTLSRDANVPPPEWNIQADPLNEKEPLAKDIVWRVARVYKNLETYQARSITVQTKVGQAIYTRSEMLARLDKKATRLWVQQSTLAPSGEPTVNTLFWRHKEELKHWSANNNQVTTPKPFEWHIYGNSPIRLASGSPETHLTWARVVKKYRISDITENNIAYFRLQNMAVSAYGKPDESYTKTTYWIRKSDGLITRLVSDVADAQLNFKSYIRTDYNPIINQPIPESEFEFGH